ncbi:MAG TPA: hypothetical protein VFQ11_07965 [Nocardioidaceae bacterium]|nr:hypothetical protein [Nocardioidaceae bacterium]
MHRVHRAWLVAGVTVGALIAAAGSRSSTGALLEPLDSWPRRCACWSRGTRSVGGGHDLGEPVTDSM